MTDGAVTTARGVGFAVDLGLELVRVLLGEENLSKSERRSSIRKRIYHFFTEFFQNNGQSMKKGSDKAGIGMI